MNLRRILQHISYDDRHSAHTSPCCRKNVQFRSLKKCGFSDANLGIGAGVFASVKAKAAVEDPFGERQKLNVSRPSAEGSSERGGPVALDCGFRRMRLATRRTQTESTACRMARQYQREEPGQETGFAPRSLFRRSPNSRGMPPRVEFDLPRTLRDHGRRKQDRPNIDRSWRSSDAGRTSAN
jgi:hypothetical protein